MIQIGCAGEGQVSDRLQKNFGQRLKCGALRLAFPNDLTYARSNKPQFGLRELKNDHGRTLADFVGLVLTKCSDSAPLRAISGVFYL